jgi:outer membrane lipoprotein carrier protein
VSDTSGTERRRRAAAAWLSLALVAGLAATAAEAPGADDPWRTLDRLRRDLASGGALQADFVQVYTPAGFSSGETESGRLDLSMPDCLRWDYVDPYRKSFLVCGARAWSWVENEPRGQRVTIDARRETGLDLLLLPAAELAGRYRARRESLGDGRIGLALEPLDPDAALVAANLEIDPAGDRPSALDYRDRDGNLTTFRFTNWRPLEDADVFSPPPGIEWSEP